MQPELLTFNFLTFTMERVAGLETAIPNVEADNKSKG